MDEATLRMLIAQKLADGQLPNESIPRISGRPATGEPCDACGRAIEPGHFVMRGAGRNDRAMQFHVDCLYLWDVARQTARPPGPLAAQA